MTRNRISSIPTNQTPSPSIATKVDYSVAALIKEAEFLSQFAEQYWQGDAARPGLSDTGKRLPGDFIPHLNSLIESLKEVQANYASMIRREPHPAHIIKRGRSLLNELSQFVAWYEATEESNIGMIHNIARVAAANINDLDSPHALAYALYNYASISKDIIELNGPAGGIDNNVADAAFNIVSELLETDRPKIIADEEVLSLAALRRKLSSLLQRKVQHLRSSIRFVFRHHPSIIRESEGIHSTGARVTSFEAYRSNRRFMMRRVRQLPRVHKIRSTDTTAD